MDFRGADIGNVLRFFAMATNWQIVPDGGLTGPVTIISPQPLTIEQAFQVLQSTLEVRGYSGQLETRGNTQILRILPLDRAVQSTTLLRDGTSGASPDELRNQVVTQVIPIENVDAGILSRELMPLVNRGASLVGSTGTNALVVTDTASNVQRVTELVRALDRAASSNRVEIFALERANATDVAEAVNGLFRQVFTRGRAGGQDQGRRGQQGQAPQAPGQPVPPGQEGQAPPAQRVAVVAVADVRTNSVLVVASDDNLLRVREIITALDSEEAQALQTRLIKMQHANAMDVADVINRVLTNSAVGGTMQGGATFRERVFGRGGAGQQGRQPTASADPFARVEADARTNSLIVTAIAERMEQVQQLVAQLDVPVTMESTSFVVPLRNAQAQDVAHVLGQAFGGQQGAGARAGQVGGFGFSPFGQQQTAAQRRQSINRRQGTTTQRTQGGRAAPVVGANGITGTLTPNGFVPDVEPVAFELEDADPSRQFVFGQAGGGGLFGRQQQVTPQFGRGQGGSHVNLLQLLNNVGVVAEPSSNSLIITTTPDNMTAIRDIVEQLDLIPRQVMIEVIIAEASLDSTQKLGFQFDARGVGTVLNERSTVTGSTSFPLGGNATASANIPSPLSPGAQIGLQAVSGRFNGLMQLLASDQRVRILSTPRVFTSNNQQATVDVVTRVPYVTSTFTGGLNIGQTLSYDYLDIGIQLDVTPRITADGLVTIDVFATASDLLGFDAVASTVDAAGRVTSQQAPRTSERSTDTSVSVRDGDIVVLAGLMRDNRTTSSNKVPLLGDIPLIGHLFRSTNTTSTKTELMIFLIPHVVDGQRGADLVRDESARIRRALPDLQKLHPMLGQDAQPGTTPPGQPAPGSGNAAPSVPQAPTPGAPGAPETPGTPGNPTAPGDLPVQPAR
ncbi:MAG TPA: secretin N-terminal domain-containing protein [Chthonomonadales bacterium]|nr:secretin N-terminal domain-containing protein [Chthonomonadales bacterium]